MQMRPKLRCDTGAVHLPQCDDCSALEGRVGAVEEDVEILEGKVTQNESDIGSLDTRTDQNDLDIINLKTRVTALEQGGVGGVTHVYMIDSGELEGALNLTASELLNAAGNTVVYYTYTHTYGDMTYTRYVPLVEVGTDGTGWEFVFYDAYAEGGGSSATFNADTVNDHPRGEA